MSITTNWMFGFDRHESGLQRNGGWDRGTWQSGTERDFYTEIEEKFLNRQRKMGSQLSKNEADAAVAAKSFSSIVLTCESRRVNGPLSYAADRGGAVLYFDRFDASKQTLRECIVSYYQQFFPFLMATKSLRTADLRRAHGGSAIPDQ
jgi:hypothetical protein